MINKVILIRPHARGKVEFPFALLYLATALKQNNFLSEIIDFHLNPGSENDLFNQVKRDSDCIVGISALSGSY